MYIKIVPHHLTTTYYSSAKDVFLTGKKTPPPFGHPPHSAAFTFSFVAHETKEANATHTVMMTVMMSTLIKMKTYDTNEDDENIEIHTCYLAKMVMTTRW